MYLIEKRKENGDGKPLRRRSLSLLSVCEEAKAVKAKPYTLTLLVKVVELLHQKGLLTGEEVMK